MKIAISCAGNTLESQVDQRFGRAPYFLIYDLESGSAEAAENSVNLQATQGAGIQSARTVVDLGVEAVITGNVGPKAFATLQAAGIEVYLVKGGTAKEAVKAYQNGELRLAGEANVEGHW